MLTGEPGPKEEKPDDKPRSSGYPPDEVILALLNKPQDVDGVPLSEKGDRLGHEGVVQLKLQRLLGVYLGEVAPGGPLLPVLQLHPGPELALKEKWHSLVAISRMS